MALFRIYAGLAGGFGGASYINTEEFVDQAHAEKYAYEVACEEYWGFEGLHGIRSVEEIMEEDDINDEEEALEVYYEERESWIDHYVIEVDEETDKKYNEEEGT